MHFGGDPLVILLLIFGMFMVMRRSGAAGWRVGQRRMEEMMAEVRAERAAALPKGPTLDQVQMLEERVRVLERIATDRGQDIAHQIDSLRDRQVQPRAEQRKAVQ